MSRHILVTGARAPAALHIARLLRRAGHKVTLADCLPAPLAARAMPDVPYLRFPPPSLAYAAFAEVLRGAVARRRFDLVLPTCEEVLFVARALEAGLPFAPEFALLRRAHDKLGFCAICRKAGVEMPPTKAVESADQLPDAVTDAGGDVVLKPRWSRFATRTLVRPDAAALARLRPTAADPWVVQAFVPGVEFCLYAVALKGRLRAFSVYRPTHRAGKGAGIYLTPEPPGRFVPMIRAITEQTGWTGQISLDVIETPDGALVPIECNPRATSGVHFFRDPAFCRVLEARGAAPQPDLSHPLMVGEAMALIALPGAFLKAPSVLADMRRARDVLDPPARLAALQSAAGMLVLAAQKRLSPLRASTWGIAYGPESDRTLSSA